MAWYDRLLTNACFVVVLIYVVWQWRTLGWWKLAVRTRKANTKTATREPGAFPVKNNQPPTELVETTEYSAPTTIVGNPSVSFVISARNEADNIGTLLADLLAQNAFSGTDEIIVINDHSTDSTASIVRSFSPRVQLLELADYLAGREVVAHKKAALTYGVQRAENEWIVCTDADCRWPAEVLTEIKQAIVAGHEFVSGPVLIAPVNNLLTAFQGLDLLAYMSLTAAYNWRGQPILANGAHLTFSKTLFQDVGGYAEIDHLPSGDDVLLLQKIQRLRPHTKFHFLLTPNAVVTTLPMLSLAEFWAQRLRWAGKSNEYSSAALWLAQGITFATSLAIIGQLVLGIWLPIYLLYGLIGWCLKMGVDYFVLRSSKEQFQAYGLLKYYVPVAILHPVYIVLVGTAAIFGGRTSWKGR